jgi:hypothetical protein
VRLARLAGANPGGSNDSVVTEGAKRGSSEGARSEMEEAPGGPSFPSGGD